MKNFYPEQYTTDSHTSINHNYLTNQFHDYEHILSLLANVVKTNDFTLGSAVDELEELIALEAGTSYAVGVGSGTDALFLSLKALNIGIGDEVITTPYTFYATIGAIVTAGATPVFADVNVDYNINPNQIEQKITSKTKAIIPVHWAGRPCQMDEILAISNQYNLHVIEDACHAIQAEYKSRRCGSFGTTGCFSFHPLKNLNVWGDGGIITTSDEHIANRLKLIRNHGLVDRDTCVEFSYNSRLDTIQAVIARYVLVNKLANITSKRISNSLLFDELLGDLPMLTFSARNSSIKEVFHLYQFSVDDQHKLYSYLRSNDIDCKVHYPTPMHLQPAASYLGYSLGDFPVAESLAKHTISLPVHEYISPEQIEFVSSKIHDFYKH